MIARILIPLDGSDRAKDAASIAQALAARFRCAITLVQVVPNEEESGVVDATVRDLDDMAARLRSLRFDVSTVVQKGSVFTCIATVAEVDRADLIVLAPHHRSGVGRLRGLFLQRVSTQLVSHGAVPVLIVPPHAVLERTVRFVNSPPPMEHPMVLALDGSTQAERIIPLATELARGLNQGVILARVISESSSHVPAARADEPHGIDESHRHLQQVLAEEREAHRYVAAMRRAIVAKTPVKVQTRVLAGDPTERLLQLAVDVDASMLALASYGQGRVANVLLGSVATALMHQSTVPLLIAPGRMALQPPHPGCGEDVVERENQE